MPSATHIASKSIISPRSVDDVRPLKVIGIGAGISGILAAIRLPRKLKNSELVIYDKNEEVGGTWFENRYPGCACGIIPLSRSNPAESYSQALHRHTRPLLPTIFRVQSCLELLLC